MRYFLSATYRPAPTSSRLELLAVALVGEDGNELYLENVSVDPTYADPRVQTQLPTLAEPLPLSAGSLERRRTSWRTAAEIVEELGDFVSWRHGPVEIWSWHGALDWAAVTLLEDGALPESWPTSFRELSEYVTRLPGIEGHADWPVRPGAAESALWSARWMTAVWKLCDQVEHERGEDSAESAAHWKPVTIYSRESTLPGPAVRRPYWKERARALFAENEQKSGGIEDRAGGDGRWAVMVRGFKCGSLVLLPSLDEALRMFVGDEHYGPSSYAQPADLYDLGDPRTDARVTQIPVQTQADLESWPLYDPVEGPAGLELRKRNAQKLVEQVPELALNVKNQLALYAELSAQDVAAGRTPGALPWEIELLQNAPTRLVTLHPYLGSKEELEPHFHETSLEQWLQQVGGGGTPEVMEEAGQLWDLGHPAGPQRLLFVIGATLEYNGVTLQMRSTPH